MTARNVTRIRRANAPAQPFHKASLIATLEEALSAVDSLRGLHSLKYELINSRDNMDGEQLAWFGNFHIGNLDGAIDAAAARVGELVHDAKMAIQGEESKS